MGEPDVPSLMDEDDEEEATRMWVGEADELPEVAEFAVGEAANQVAPEAPAAPGESIPRVSGERAAAGLSASELFDDVFEAGPAPAGSSAPVDGALVQLPDAHDAAAVATIQLNPAGVVEAVKREQQASADRAANASRATNPPSGLHPRAKLLLAVGGVSLAMAALTAYLFGVGFHF